MPMARPKTTRWPRAPRRSAAAGAGSGRGRPAPRGATPVIGRPDPAFLDLEHLGLFALPDAVGLGDEAVGQALQALLALLEVVLGGHVLLAQGAQVVVAFAADVAHGDAPLLH